MRYHEVMRTTLELDDDIVSETKRLARERGVSLGHLISELTRQSLTSPLPRKLRNGVEIFVSKPGTPRIDMEFVNRLRDEE
jgi:hypothetical protein